MVRVISSSSLGFGDYGGSIIDKEVDGLVFEKEYNEAFFQPPVVSQTPLLKGKSLSVTRKPLKKKAAQ